MCRYITAFLIIVTIILGGAGGKSAEGGRCTDNELIAQWQVVKEKQDAERELENIMTALNEYCTWRSPEFRLQLSECIQEVSKENGLEPALLLAMIFTESSFKETARSSKGAVGLMQLLPSTGHAVSKELQIEWKGRETLYDTRNNIRMGAYYLKKLLNRFNDLDMALTAYNAGPTRVVRYMQKGKTYSQTYAKKVSGHCEMFAVSYFQAAS